jgi:hypothetical protein
MTKTFAEFVRTNVKGKTKTDHMVDLLADFELGIKNGHSMNDLCLFLSESEGPFHGQSIDSISKTYYRARKKALNDLDKKRGEQ